VNCIDRKVFNAYLICMTRLEIISVPDKLLRQKSAPVEQVDDDLRGLLHDMLETMYEAPGVGLAAIQVAVPRRALVIDIAREGEEKSPLFFINPEIVEHSDEMRSYEEGCLSVPGHYAEIERPANCTVNYIDMAGKQQQMVCRDMLATVIQHEMDHMDGMLFIDYLSKLRRDRVIRKLSKERKHASVL
jgi:peptide deformylase